MLKVLVVMRICFRIPGFDEIRIVKVLVLEALVLEDVILLIAHIGTLRLGVDRPSLSAKVIGKHSIAPSLRLPLWAGTLAWLLRVCLKSGSIEAPCQQFAWPGMPAMGRDLPGGCNRQTAAFCRHRAEPAVPLPAQPGRIRRFVSAFRKKGDLIAEIPSR